MSEVISEVASRLESILQCAICLELFKEPRVLSCGHVFCEVCLRRLIGRNARSVKCPTCQKFCSVTNMSKIFILKDVVDTQISITSANQSKTNPSDNCEVCQQAFSIDDLWACDGCDKKSTCSKCMVKNSHGKCENVPNSLAIMFEETQRFLDEWSRTVCGKRLTEISVGMREFKNRVEEMRRGVTGLRQLLREDLLARNGDAVFDQYSAEFSSVQNDSKMATNLCSSNRHVSLGVRLITCKDEVNEAEERMRALNDTVQSSAKKFEQCLEALNVFTTRIRAVLSGQTIAPDPAVVEAGHTGSPRETTAEENISDLGIDVHDFSASTNESPSRSSDNMRLIELDGDETNNNVSD